MYSEKKKKFKLTDKNITSKEISTKKLLLIENNKKPNAPKKNKILETINITNNWNNILNI